MKTILFILLIASIAEANYSPAHFEQLSKKIAQPFFSEAVIMGQTVNNNPLTVYIITKIKYKNLSQLIGTPTILICSYMHAREPYSVQLVYRLYQKISKGNQSKQLDNFLKRGILILYPFVNIDGYNAYIKQGSNHQIRKNLNGNKSLCTQGSPGVDINRNFDSSFGTFGTSNDPCSEEYRGVKPFSQKQAQVFQEIFKNYKVILSIDVHSYGNQWIYPYASDSKGEKLKGHPLNEMYTDVVQALRGKNSKIQSCFESLGYVADGVYIDWVLDQGVFSLAYEVGQRFQNDEKIQSGIQHALTDFDLLFAKTGPVIQTKQLDNFLLIESRSLSKQSINVTMLDIHYEASLLPGGIQKFPIPHYATQAYIVIEGQQKVVYASVQYRIQRFDSVLMILIFLGMLFLMFGVGYWQSRLIQGKKKKANMHRPQNYDMVEISFRRQNEG